MANNDKSPVLGSLIIAKGSVSQGGVQIIVENGSVVGLLEAIKFGEVVEEDGEKLFRPFPVKKDRALLLSVRTPKGVEGKLVWGDTHALHASHQGENLPFFTTLLNATLAGNAFEVEVLGATPVAIKKGKGKKSMGALSKDAC